MTYLISDVVSFQLVVYLLIFLCYCFACKDYTRGATKSYWLLNTLTLAYFVRTLLDLMLFGKEQELYGNDFSVVFFMLNGIVLPCAFLPLLDYCRGFKSVLLLLGIMLLGCLFWTYWNFLNGVIYMSVDQRVMGNKSLGVIQYGHLGLTAALVGWYFFHQTKEQKSNFIWALLLIGMGVITMLMAGTRSALMAASVIFTLYLYSNAKIRILLPFVVFCIISFAFTEEIQAFFDALGVNSVNRILRLLDESAEDQSSGRYLLWSTAWEELSDSLILGVSSFFKFKNLNYVHNSIIEISYALGIIGGAVFVYLNYRALKICIAIFRGKIYDDLFLASLYIQQFVYSLFSESILRLSFYWVCLAIIIGLEGKYKKLSLK